MNIKPIRTEQDHAEALAEIERLWAAEPGSDEYDNLQVLAMLVDVYEKEHFSIEAPDAVEAIRFRMEQQGLTRNDLLAYFKTRSRVSEVLSRKRPLTLSMIRSLHRGLAIPLEVLVAEPRRSRKRRTPRAATARKANRQTQAHSPR